MREMWCSFRKGKPIFEDMKRIEGKMTNDDDSFFFLLVTHRDNLTAK